jgi:hypothetical protein
VRLTTPVLAAAQLQVATALVDGVPTSRVTWLRRSRGADRLELQRRRIPAAGEPGAWETLPLTSVEATSYVDAGLSAWEDGARFAYRVVYRAGAPARAPVEGVGTPGRPLPLGLTATAGASGIVHLEWIYPGVAPVEVEVRRSAAGGPEGAVAVVPSPARSLDDGGAPTATIVTYSARAFLPGTSLIDEYASDRGSATVLVPAAAWEGKLQARLVALPEADAVARGPAGEFALACGGASDRGVSVSFPVGAGWSTFTSAPDPWAYLSRPGVAFDAAGVPHAMYEIRRPADAGGGRSVMHRWRDAGGEHEEEAGVITALGEPPSVSALPADGVPQYLWRDCVGAPCAGTPVRWSSKSPSGWAVEDVPAPWQRAERRSDVVIDPSGRPAFVAVDPVAGTVLLRRLATGWAATPLPAATSGPGSNVKVLFTPAGRAIVARSWFAPPPRSGNDVLVLEHDGAADPVGARWGAEQVLESFAETPDAYAVALSPDGTRLAVAAGGPAAKVQVRGLGGWAAPLALPPHGRAAVGFTPAGKLWVLTGPAAGTPPGATLATYALHEEP